MPKTLKASFEKILLALRGGGFTNNYCEEAPGVEAYYMIDLTTHRKKRKLPGPKTPSIPRSEFSPVWLIPGLRITGNSHTNLCAKANSRASSLLLFLGYFLNIR